MQGIHVILVLCLGLGLLLISSIVTYAQLDKESPSGNLTEDVDISISPGEPLPANGTVTVSTEGATVQIWMHFHHQESQSLFKMTK
jgi:hypothetical protein